MPPSPGGWRVVAGLGNPGARYEQNRHNVGFWAVDAIAARFGAEGFRHRFQSAASEVRIGDWRVLLLKPQTFMNLSGNAVREAAAFYKIPPEHMVVFHDELDLAPGRVKCKQGGGSAGHNGLKSMDQQVGNPYFRVRLGIGHPGRPELVSPYVLSDVPKDERPAMEDAIDACAEALPFLLGGDMPGFTNAVAQRLNPPKPIVKKEPNHGV